MTRFGLVFGALVAVAGCGWLGGTMGGNAPFAPEGEPLPGAGRLVAWQAVREQADAAPDCARIPEAALGFTRMGGGRGYFWLGYTTADVGQEDLNKVGRGEGFTLGGGFKLSEAAHTFLEFAYERSLKHRVDPQITTESKAIHERSLAGFRTTTAPRARMQNQPRPYISYGIGYNFVNVKYDAGTGTVGFFMNGSGYYVGFGCEFPSEGLSSFSFDAKFHTWIDEYPPEQPLALFGDEATFGSLSFALLWMNRF